MAQAEDVERLRELVQTVYPGAHISVQDTLGALPGQPIRVYIYRDGYPPSGEP